MGVNRRSSWRGPSFSSYDSYSSSTPNPDPKKFTIIKHEEVGEYLILEVKYDGCTNYEGKKILVYQGVKIIDLWKQGSLDPHFSNNKQYHSPIARFRPDKEGWTNALRFTRCQR